MGFILAYADHCIHRDISYQKTVLDELSKVSNRSVTWPALWSKLIRILEAAGVTKPSTKYFVKRGTTYFDVSSLPPDIRAQLNVAHRKYNVSTLPGGNYGTARAATDRDETEVGTVVSPY